MKIKIILALALFLGFAGAFLNMLGWSLNIFAPLFTAPFSFSGLGNGFLLIINRLFFVSEQNQLFIYDMFHISSPQGDWDGNIAGAFVVIFIMLAAVSYAIAASRRKIPAAAAVFAIIAAQVYFGVFPSAFWNVLLFAALAMVFAKERATIRGVVPMAIVLVLVFAGIWAIHPDRSAWLFELSEAMRDWINEPISQSYLEYLQTRGADFDPAEMAYALANVSDNMLAESPITDFAAQFDDIAHGAEIGFINLDASLLPAIIFVISTMLAAAIIRFVPPFIMALKQRKMFDLDDSAVAINNMFAHLLQWLEIAGLERKNAVYSAYCSSLSQIVSQEYSQEYAQMTELWQRAVYSDHASGEAERAIMRKFLEKTKSHVWKNSDIATKLKIKFQYFL